MNDVVTIAIAFLATVFVVVLVASIVAIVFVCKQRYCKQNDLISSQHDQNGRQDSTLVENMEGQSDNTTDVELDDVRINTNLDEILQDPSWVNDATGLAPHCLAILKTCHNLSEKLVGMTMGNAQNLRQPETLTDLVAVAKRISPRVDEVVKSMYPPLDPRLLEARCTALVLSVSHLVLVTKNACRLSGVLDWIEQSMADVEDHLKVLREASIAYETMLEQPPQQIHNDTNNQSLSFSQNGPDVCTNRSPGQCIAQISNNESSQV